MIPDALRRVRVLAGESTGMAGPPGVTIIEQGADEVAVKFKKAEKDGVYTRTDGARFKVFAGDHYPDDATFEAAKPKATSEERSAARAQRAKARRGPAATTETAAPEGKKADKTGPTETA